MTRGKGRGRKTWEDGVKLALKVEVGVRRSGKNV